jgi:3-oxoacyl-[acyl-carrier protein] reductase
VDLGLAGKRILVTGSSRGIGYAIARHFLREEARVAFTSRNRNDLDMLVSDLTEKVAPEKVMALKCDFTNVADVVELCRSIESAWGGVDIVVANVGSGTSVPDPIPDQEHFEAVFYENFYAPVNTAREFLPLLKASRGSLLFITSIAGMEAIGAPIDYATAKTAVMSFAKNLARKIAADGVRVNCIAPGNILFPGGSWDRKVKSNPEGVQRIIEEQVPMKRFGTPDEIAAAAIFICSAQAGFITGTVLCVDGGQTTLLF